MRHAGVQKKLARNLKPAERALGERPHTALRMTLDAKPDKKQLTMLATCMEAGFWQSMTLGHAEWRERRRCAGRRRVLDPHDLAGTRA